MRIRKNAARLMNAEWERLCEAIVALKHTFPPGSTVSVYDQFVAMHGHARRAHGTSEFLPWHREFIRRFEVALQAVDPGVSLPYWNWGLGEQEETEYLFDDRRIGPRPETEGAVTSGYFSVAGWNGQTWTPALRRGAPQPFGGLPTREQVLPLLRKSTHEALRVDLEILDGIGPRPEALHGGVHVWIGGDMRRPGISPRDPIFFLHHAQVDRVWALWQRLHPQARWTASNEPMWPWDGSDLSTRQAAVVPNVSPRDLVRPTDVLDTRELGYVYDGEDAAREVRETGSIVTHDWSNISLGADYGREPAVVACLHTFAGADPAGVRVRQARGRSVDFKVEEEESRDQETAHVPESIAYVAGKAGLIHDVSGKVVGELGTIRMGQHLRDRTERIHLEGSYDRPVVVATISSCNGYHPAHIRVLKAEATWFEARIEEWAYLDRSHATESVSYLVVEAGRHRLQDGAEVIAGLAEATHDWTAVEFDSSLGSGPVVLSQCMTRRGRDPVVTRQRNVAATGFEVRLQEEEASADGGWHTEETVGYAAFG